MAKPRIYHKWEIPRTVVELVRAVCDDYDRRSRMIQFGSVDGEVLEAYIALNRAVDKALEDVEAGIRKSVMSDICCRRGYHFSQASPFLAKNTYYARKRKVIHDIAVELALIP